MVQSLGIQKLVSKITEIWKTSDKHWKVQNLMGFCPKNTFLQLKHYIQWSYLTLYNISTTCVKIHQITYVIFETITHFSQHNSSVSFKLNYYILSTKVAHQSASFIKRLSTARVKLHQISQVIFERKSQFFFKVWIFLRCHER